MTPRLKQNCKIATLTVFADLISVEFIFAIYDLICKIEFRVTKKYSISNKKTHDLNEKTHEIDINHEIKLPEI